MELSIDDPDVDRGIKPISGRVRQQLEALVTCGKRPGGATFDARERLVLQRVVEAGGVGAYVVFDKDRPDARIDRVGVGHRDNIRRNAPDGREVPRDLQVERRRHFHEVFQRNRRAA